MEWLGDTMTPPMAKHARILGESNDRSCDPPMRFKVVCSRNRVRRWMWRGPHPLSCLGDT